MVHSFYHPRGGDTTYMDALTRLLEAAGHRVTPFACQHPSNRASDVSNYFAPPIGYHSDSPFARVRAGITLLERGIWNREAARALETLIQHRRPDVAHIQHLHRHLTPSILPVLKRARVPVVWTLHDFELLCPTGHFFQGGAPCEACPRLGPWSVIWHRCEQGSVAASTLLALEKTVHRLLPLAGWVDRFLCPSRFLRDRMIAAGLPANRVMHVPNPWMPATLESGPTPEGLPSEVGILFAGRLIPEKGVDVLLEAAREGLPVPVTIVGEGPERSRLERRYSALVQGGRVRFLGWQPRSAVQQLLESAVAVAVPSLWYENLPYAILEAWAAGRAVVVSDLGGMRELVREDVDGLRAPPGSGRAWAVALRRLCAEPTLAQALGAEGKRRLESEFSGDRHLEAMTRIYAELGAG